MGSGIAQVFAMNREYQVILCDLTPELSRAGIERIRGNLERMVGKGKLSGEEAEEILSRIRTGGMEELADCGQIGRAHV